MKWVPGRPEIDPLSGQVQTPANRFGGISLADQSALEVGLQLGTRRSLDVVAITVGGTRCEQSLRDALAAGARRAIRIDAPGPLSSAETARVLALSLDHASIIVCGDYSFDRGSGSVPAFLAAELGISQALGVVSLTAQVHDLLVTRRLDGGRRENLRIGDRAVISVEGSVAQLRRATLANTLAIRNNEIEVTSPPLTIERPVSISKPFRPRPRTLAMPHGNSTLERLNSITNVATTSTRGEQIELDPQESAAYILQTLTHWGYIE